MDMLVIEGGMPLSGEVLISGSKNASLPILVSCLLSESNSMISNVPHLSDTKFLLELLDTFGASSDFSNNQVSLDCVNIDKSLAHYEEVRKMRASILVLAPLLARIGEATVSLPGGCSIGGRPVDIHIDGLRALGAEIDVSEGYIHARLKKGCFCGAEYVLPLPSVGATEQLILAAVLAKGTTTLKGVAKEPEIIDLCSALNMAGAKITGFGTSVITIDGVDKINEINYRIGPDRIEAGTYIAIAAATKSKIRIKNVVFSELKNVIERFEKAHVCFEQVAFDPLTGLADINVIPPKRLKAVDIETAAHPGFPTDMQAQFMAAMTVAQGCSNIYERVFENRMMHVPELLRMGADITVSKGVARVVGQELLNSAPVMATDLRASASLVIAALCAEGKSEIRRVYHLDRGYEYLEKKLGKIGAQITRSKQTLAKH